MKRSKFEALISDADILIDFCNGDKKILSTLAKQFCEIYITPEVLEEVEQLSKAEAKKLGLIIIEPELKQYEESSKKGGPLSREDKLCLIVARDKGWVCATNDKKLRQECEKQGIEIVWGLELILILFRDGKITKTQAEEAAWKIHKTNLRITEEVVEEFIEKLNT